MNFPNFWHKTLKTATIATMLLGSFSLGVFFTLTMRETLEATAQTNITSPTGVVEPRDVYYPGTEALQPDEMRIVKDR